MQSLTRNLAVLAACFLSFAAAARAQVSGMEGTIKGADGKPIVGAVVKIERQDIRGNYNVKTDKKGHWGHYGLPLGTYNVSLEIDGKVADQMKNVRTRLGDPTQIQLAPRVQQAAAPAAGAQAAPPPEKDRSLSKEQREAMEKQNKEREAQIAKNKALNDAFTAGKAASEQKQWDVAIENFKKASEMEGGNQPVVWSNLAEAYANAAKDKPTDATTLRTSAIEAYKKAIELKPDDASLYNNYALVLGYQKQIPDAQAALEKAATLDPPGAGRYYYNLGAVLVNTAQNEAACPAFKKAIDADPNYADAYYQYGICLVSQAKTDASGKIEAVPGTIEALQKYIDLKPDGPSVEAAKGMITTLGGTVSTVYVNPNAPKTAPAKKKKTTTTNNNQ
jgi:tetratricopeptide (TPR) repeat protein